MRDRADYAKKVAAKKARKAEIAKRARQQLPEGQAAAVDRESFIAAG